MRTILFSRHALKVEGLAEAAETDLCVIHADDSGEFR